MAINVFSRAFSGYNRHEVDEYIADLNRSYLKTRRDYEKKIEILEAELSRAKRQEPEKTVSDTPAVTPPALEATFDAELAEKSRRYDEISQKVGEILMNANAEALGIVRQADEKVRTTLTDTTSKLRTELTSLICKLNEMLEEAEAGLAVDEVDNTDNEA